MRSIARPYGPACFVRWCRESVSGFCADRSSAIVCGEDKQELVALGMIWGIVCIGILVIFILLQGLKRMREKRS